MINELDSFCIKKNLTSLIRRTFLKNINVINKRHQHSNKHTKYQLIFILIVYRRKTIACKYTWYANNSFSVRAGCQSHVKVDVLLMENNSRYLGFHAEEQLSQAKELSSNLSASYLSCFSISIITKIVVDIY